MMNFEEMYKNNKDFKRYIDKYCQRADGNITPQEAFTHDLIKGKGGIAEMYAGKN